MKFSEQWLRTWVNPRMDSNELVEAITMAGLEVDDVDPVAGDFQGVIVGEVVWVGQHPGADKLSLCRVSDGDSTQDVVCGAPNVRTGLKAPFARVGGFLSDGQRIERAQVRGAESNGMLCSEAELELSEDGEGLMELPEDAPTGADLREYLSLDDRSLDVDLTPNRSDCLSIRGVARDLGALTSQTFEDLEPEAVTPVHSEIPSIRVDAPQACPRYVGRIIRQVDTSAPTPMWMRERLRRSGIRSIDAVVDVTNYVMLEMGQPMHAFDRARVRGGIVVRMATEGETLQLLDGQTLELGTDNLVIADHQRPLALAGIMGGEESGVNEDTRDILLESAFFDPVMLAGKARAHGLHTDSSHRFERGVDWDLQRAATERATALLLDIVGGEAGEVIEIASTEHLPASTSVYLREARVAEVLGMTIDRTTIEEILSRLGLRIVRLHRDGWEVAVPSFRFDIALEVDLIEEIGRIYGYNRLPVTEAEGRITISAGAESVRPLSRVQDHLVALDYQEAITYSFVDPKLQQRIDPEAASIELANPISSDMAVMRTSLWPGLLQTLSHNENRQQNRVRLFETGLRFRREADGIAQESMLAGLITGPATPENWVNETRNVDFYDAKGDLESLAGMLGKTLEFEPAQHPALHPGQSARVSADGKVVGWLGTLHPQLQKMLDLHGRVCLYELSLESVLNGYVPHFKVFSKFPEVRRDLAILIGEETGWAAVEAVARKAAGDALTGLRVFDVYQGQHIEKGQKSVALSLYWQHPERTLGDEEVQGLFDTVTQALQNELGAQLRS
ncbi:phenylalanyl-tRNA synthetase beta subunit [Halospina denitrificans]|uniref:Phenylalanine--tRNA ligase beta subunit n=1 Tax=Halospina denitrificans TaxID=332522 RepID=A0A4R7JN20_9GAMM|nr:phenylalanine--tRNA ligase subunit beta [Halospina denitrificans]TDT38587.1 phenylalanyl-tRNA synthetase beta subunit [Halospina denitrificans]